ncbi:MAG: gamma-glutamyl-gamma-aminobutyrate hydrolase family protein [Alphaproteobacteria bacterium]
MSQTPLVAVSSCVKEINTHRFHATNQRYLDALTEISGCFPVLLPAVGEKADPGVVLDHVSGLLLTGSPSNVHPENYDDELSAPYVAVDRSRDATTLPTIRAAVARGIPVFAVCRGIQELNVALGGSLYQFVHLLPGKRDHRSDRAKPVGQRAGLAHPVRLTEGGLLRRLLGAEEVMVNSLHGQAINRPAPGLVVEATSEDGVVEAVSAPDAAGWVLGVQWHPEALFREDAPSARLFEAFGAAAKAHAEGRARPALVAAE